MSKSLGVAAWALAALVAMLVFTSMVGPASAQDAAAQLAESCAAERNALAQSDYRGRPDVFREFDEGVIRGNVSNYDRASLRNYIREYSSRDDATYRLFVCYARVRADQLADLRVYPYTQADVVEYQERCAEIRNLVASGWRQSLDWVDHRSADTDADGSPRGMVERYWRDNTSPPEALEAGGRRLSNDQSSGASRLEGCAMLIRAEQLRRRRPAPSNNAAERADNVSPADERNADDRNREDSAERLRRRARNIEALDPTVQAGESGSCIAVDTLESYLTESETWIITRYSVTNTCGRNLVVSFKATPGGPSFYVSRMVGTMPFVAWRYQEGGNHEPWPLVGFEYLDPTTASDAMWAGEVRILEEWQFAERAQDIYTSVAACDYVKVVDGRQRIQTMLREVEMAEPHKRVVCHPLIDPQVDPALLRLLRIGEPALQAPLGEDERLTRCLNRDGALTALHAELSCAELARAQSSPTPLRALGAYNQGRARLLAHDAEGALQLTQQAIELRPTASAYINLAAAHFEAAQQCADAIARVRVRDTQVDRAASCAPQAEHYRAALAAYDAALRLAPNHLTAARMRAYVEAVAADPSYAPRAREYAWREWALPGHIEEMRQACVAQRPEGAEVDVALEDARIRRLGDLNRGALELSTEARGWAARIPFTPAASAEFKYLSCLISVRVNQIYDRHRQLQALEDQQGGQGADYSTFADLTGTLPTVDMTFARYMAIGALLAALVLIILFAQPWRRDERAEAPEEDRDTPAAPYEARYFGLTLALFALPFTAILVILFLGAGFLGVPFAGYTAFAVAFIGVPLSAFVGGWLSYAWLARRPRAVGFFSATWLSIVAGVIGIVIIALCGFLAWPFHVLEQGEALAGAEAMGWMLLTFAAVPSGAIMARLWLPFYLGLVRKRLRGAGARRLVSACALVLPIALTFAAGVVRIAWYN